MNIPRCACGRYSIGTCLDCSRPLCELHGQGDNAFLCADCVLRRSDPARYTPPVPDLNSVQQEIASAKAEQQAREQVTLRKHQQTLRWLDQQTSKAVLEFLAAAQGMALDSVVVWQDIVANKGFRARGSHWEKKTVPAYVLTRQDAAANDNYGDSRTVSILESGQVLLCIDSSRHDSQTKRRSDDVYGKPEAESEFDILRKDIDWGVHIFSRRIGGPGLLPFHIGRYVSQVYTPGVIPIELTDSAEGLLRDFIELMAKYLASHNK